MWTPAAHPSPEYRDPRYGIPNYVYVRVRNRGSFASSVHETLQLYWAKASTGHRRMTVRATDDGGEVGVASTHLHGGGAR